VCGVKVEIILGSSILIKIVHSYWWQTSKVKWEDYGVTSLLMAPVFSNSTKKSCAFVPFFGWGLPYGSPIATWSGSSRTNALKQIISPGERAFRRWTFCFDFSWRASQTYARRMESKPLIKACDVSDALANLLPILLFVHNWPVMSWPCKRLALSFSRVEFVLLSGPLLIWREKKHLSCTTKWIAWMRMRWPKTSKRKWFPFF